MSLRRHLPFLACSAVAVAVLACTPPRETVPPGRVDEPAVPPPSTAPAEPRPASEEPSSVTEPEAATAASGVWTHGIVDGEGLAAGVAVLEEVRAGRHEAFDRLVFAFAPAVPGHHLEYVDRPVRRCGSGEPVPLPGDAWLEVRLEPAVAHTEEGEPTVGRELPADVADELGNVRRVVLTCDFEAVVTWVLAVESPNDYRVTVLADPPRLVVDVRR